MPEPRNPFRRLPDQSPVGPFIPPDKRNHPPKPDAGNQIPLYPPGEEPSVPNGDDEEDGDHGEDRPEVEDLPDRDDTTEISPHPVWEYTDGGTTEVVEKDRRPGESKEEYMDRKRYEPKGGSEEIPDSNVDFRI